MALFVTHSGAVGGAEVVLARYLRERPDEHEVLLLSSGAAADFFADTGASVSTLPILDRHVSFTRNLSARAAATAAAALVTRLPDISAAIASSAQRVVVTNSMKAHVLIPSLARRNGRTVGIRLHDIVSVGSASATARRLLRLSAAAAASVSCVSRAVASAASTIGMQRVEWFYNGVDVDEAGTRTRCEGLRLLVVSQLAPWKGVHRVLDTVSELRRSGVDATLDVVGDAIFGGSDYRECLSRRSAALGLGHVVRWHGYVSDPRPFYRSADIFIHLPEEPDPLPTSVMEAQGFGLPVVASAGGGISEIVLDGETGLLVLPEANDAATAVRRLTDPALRSAYGAAGRRRVEQCFSSTAYVEAFDRWLASLGAGGRVSAGVA